jgi:hypothetical protein
MKILLLIGAIVVVALIIAGALFLAENVELKKGKRK